MATKESMDAGRRLGEARRSAYDNLLDLNGGMSLSSRAADMWRAIRILERAAIKVGEARERGRKQKAVR